MTLVAVSQRTEFISEYKEVRDGLDHRWYEFLDVCHITPLLIPNHFTIAYDIINQFCIHGIFLTGGDDSASRFETETALIKFAIQKKLPIFGVCHGMQAIQQYFNVRLKKISGHVKENQEILIHGKTAEVNSFHHIGTTDTVSDLIVWAKARDGIVKGICHQYLPIVGIMWHPERYRYFKENDIKLVSHLFANEHTNSVLYDLRNHKQA